MGIQWQPYLGEVCCSGYLQDNKHNPGIAVGETDEFKKTPSLLKWDI